MTLAPYRLALTEAALASATRQFAECGWAWLAPILEPADADALAAHLVRREDWHSHVNQGAKLFEIPRAVGQGFDADKRAALDAAVYRNATDGFQHRFEAIRVSETPGDWHDEPLHRMAATLNSTDFLDHARRVSGSPDIAFADAQATLYAPGDFLTRHDDAVAGKNRRAAYVFSLTRRWRADWGGLLLLEEDGDRQTALVPGWNRLTLFAVPRPHSVSLVSPAAPVPRLSVTGWLRARGPTGFHTDR